MSVRTEVISEIERIRGVSAGKELSPLTDDTALLDSGLDSLGIAILVTRLEDNLGLDPFSDSDIVSPPVTLGDLIGLYENAAIPS